MDTTLRDEITALHARICSGLADANRILILYTLADTPHSVNQLSEELNISQPTVSRHLKVLRERGMVRARRDGQSIIYSLGDERIIQALDIMRAFMADSLRERSEIAASMRDELTS